MNMCHGVCSSGGKKKSRPPLCKKRTAKNIRNCEIPTLMFKCLHSRKCSFTVERLRTLSTWVTAASSHSWSDICGPSFPPCLKLFYFNIYSHNSLKYISPMCEKPITVPLQLGIVPKLYTIVYKDMKSYI